MRRLSGTIAIVAVSGLGAAACLFPSLGNLGTDGADAASDSAAVGDGNAPDGPLSDASATGDASVRFKNITFENGLVVDPVLGVSSVDYPMVLVNADAGGPSLDGIFSVRTKQPPADAGNALSSITQAIVPAPDHLYISLLMRLESMPNTQPRFLKIGNNQTSFEADVIPLDATSYALRWKVRLTTTDTTTNTIGDSPALVRGNIYRIGLVLVQQSSASAADALVEGYVADMQTPFGAPFATSTQQTLLGPSDEIVLGTSTGNFVEATFDDIYIDSAQMP